MFENDFFYFTVKDFASFFNLSLSKANKIIRNLTEKEFLIRVEKGKYLLVGFEKEKILSNPFFIATKIVYPSYVSYFTVLNFYGFTEQVPRTVFLATTKKKKSIEFNGMNFKYVKIKPEKFFGYIKQRVGDLDVLIADKEKSIIDSLDQMDYGGGIMEISKSLYNAMDEINLERLIDYAVKFKNKSLCSRLGYLLDLFGIDGKKLLKYKSNSFVKLDPKNPNSNTWNKKWGINVNVSKRKLLAWRRT